MKTIGHLEQFDLTLNTLGPVFVGCGKKFTKKEYVFLPGRSSTVLLPKEADFFRYLVEHNLVDQYESYILGAGTASLRDFLKMDCHLSDAEIRRLCPYELRAEEALDASHSLKEINAFIRDPYGRVFVPGSSLKGALRTILLAEKVMKENKDRPLPFTDRKNGFPEWQYFNSLHLNSRRAEDAVNSILRGVQISDSEPIADEDMMLAGKSDFSVDGVEKKINLCRECIRPGTKISFPLTLDHSVLKGAITAESIRKAIAVFDDFYLDNYLNCFASPDRMPEIDFSQVIFLGGGAGYFSKTVSYPYCGKMGLSEVCRQMQGQFRNHYHHLDEQRGISPHTMKYALYQGLYYPYGLCRLEMK